MAGPLGPQGAVRSVSSSLGVSPSHSSVLLPHVFLQRERVENYNFQAFLIIRSK